MNNIDSMTDDGGEASERQRFKPKKPVSRQYVCRSLAFAATLVVVAVGLVFCVFGGIASFASPAKWLPDLLGSERAISVAYGSFALGLVMALLGCCGLFGVLRRKKNCLWLFGLLVAVLLTGCSAGVAIVWETEWALAEWKSGGLTLFADDEQGSGGGGDDLAERAVETIRNIHVEVAALYAYCAPEPSGVTSLVNALDDAASQPALNASEVGSGSSSALLQILPAPAEEFTCTETDLRTLFEQWCAHAPSIFFFHGRARLFSFTLLLSTLLSSPL